MFLSIIRCSIKGEKQKHLRIRILLIVFIFSSIIACNYKNEFHSEIVSIEVIIPEFESNCQYNHVVFVVKVMNKSKNRIYKFQQNMQEEDFCNKNNIDTDIHLLIGKDNLPLVNESEIDSDIIIYPDTIQYLRLRSLKKISYDSLPKIYKSNRTFLDKKFNIIIDKKNSTSILVPKSKNITIDFYIGKIKVDSVEKKLKKYDSIYYSTKRDFYKKIDSLIETYPENVSQEIEVDFENLK